MKVKVSKAGKHSYWYSTHIGEIFEVINHDEENFKVMETCNMIGKDDCIIIKNNKMTKSDLKTGMLLETRDESLRIVLLGTLMGDGLKGEGTLYGDLDYYSEDLTYDGNLGDRLTVMKVYKPRFNYNLLSFDLSNYKLIWERERERKIEITVTVNGKKVSPSALSKETWNNLRKT